MLAKPHLPANVVCNESLGRIASRAEPKSNCVYRCVPGRPWLRIKLRIKQTKGRGGS